VITIGEIKKGIKKLADSRRKDALVEWLNDGLLVRSETGSCYRHPCRALLGKLAADLDRQGRRMPPLTRCSLPPVCRGNCSW